MEEQAKERATGLARLRERKIPKVPIVFLGLGVYRAWIEIVFVGSFADLPAGQFGSRDMFDAVMIVTLFACAFLSKRTGAFFNRRIIYMLSGTTLIVSTALMFCSVYFPAYAAALALPATLLGGVGIALIILLWSELFGCLNPLRVALYYSVTIVAGAIILYIYRGFQMPWLFAMTMVLPIASLIMVRKGFHSLPEKSHPSTQWQSFAIPWKLIILMAIYAFAYGMLEEPLYAGTFGPHSAIGTVVVSLLVAGCVIIQGERFDFNIIYRLALPLVAGAFLPISSLVILGTEASNFCISAGYTALSILVMMVFCNLTYRFGASAIWLFGIERGVRAIAMFAGRYTPEGLSYIVKPEQLETVIAVLAIIAVIVVTMAFMSQREVENKWGGAFFGDESVNDAAAERARIVKRCGQLAGEFHLSMREEEVLLLLSERKTISEVERELFIANGTAKAHVRHIYQKLDIHSREELFEKLGMNPLPEEDEHQEG